VSEVTCSVRSAGDLARVEHPSIGDTAVLAETISVAPAGADPAALTRIGFLSDMPTGVSLAEYVDPIILAFEDAVGEGRLRSPVELVASHVVGLPTGSEANVVAAYRDLIDQGCRLVLSTGVTNNALVLREQIEQARVPYITMAGTTRFTGDYCFSLANGGHGEEAALLAAYLAERRYLRVVLTGEGSSGDAEYQRSSASRRRFTASRSSIRTTPRATRSSVRTSTTYFAGSAGCNRMRSSTARSAFTANISTPRSIASAGHRQK
jgi:hypothetical protein